MISIALAFSLTGRALVGLGAFLAGVGSLLSGIAALRAAGRRGRKEVEHEIPKQADTPT
jgi:hypothetical protein